MSVIASAASASAASPVVDLFKHGHKKGGHAASSTDLSAASSTTDSSAASSTQAPATNHGLFSSLLDSLQQMIGISLTAPTSAAGITATAASSAAHASNSLGANVNARV
jgi:hypothetical protein